MNNKTKVLFNKKQLIKFYNFFKVPKVINDIYIDRSVNKNNSSLRLISYLFIVLEIFNIARIIFFTPGGLQNFNNIVYFSFYCLLILASILFLILQKVFARNTNANAMLHFFITLFIIVWNVLVNAFDLSRSPVGGITVYLTAIFGIAVFIHLKPFYICMYSLIGYVLFASLIFDTSSSVIMINMTIATLVSATVAIINFRYLVTELILQKEMAEINQQLKIEQQKLRFNLEKYNIVMQQANDILFEWTLANDALKEDMIEFSTNWNEKFGYPTIIHNWHNWVMNNLNWKYEGRLALGTLIDRCLNSSTSTYFEQEINLSADTWFILRITMQYDENQKPVKGIGFLMDIQKQKKEIIQLNSKLQIDPLTGILNQLAIANYAKEYFSDKITHESITMIIIDLDDFKQINDQYGHPCGDHVLTCTAHTLKSVFRNTDGIGRMGGDEFSIILFNQIDHSVIKNKLTQVMQELAKIQWENQEINMRCSIGIVVADNSVKSYEELYKLTDSALYKAKQLGKNCYHFLSVLM